MKIFFDFEMTGLHPATTPISLGIVSNDGKTFYAEFNDYDQGQVTNWVTENVISKLRFSDYLSNPKIDFDHHAMKAARWEVGAKLREWLSQFGELEFWGDVLTWDWMLFCAFFPVNEGLPDLPPGWLYIPFDIAVLFKWKDIDPNISREDFAQLSDSENKHNALYDAKVIKACYRRLAAPF